MISTFLGHPLTLETNCNRIDLPVCLAARPQMHFHPLLRRYIELCKWDLGPFELTAAHVCVVARPAQCGSSRPTISAYQTVLIWCQEAGMETPVSALFLLYSWQRKAGGNRLAARPTALPPTTGTVQRCPCWHNTLSPPQGERCFSFRPKTTFALGRADLRSGTGFSASGSQGL